MEIMMLHRGRLIDHLHLVVEDYPGALCFYSAVLQALEVPIGGTGEDYFWADELFVSTIGSEAAVGVPTGRHHLAFQAGSREMVDAFYAAGLAAGGRDHGAPGIRPYHPDYYAAFLLDPAGNNVEAVYHGPAARSAPSVTVEFEA
jgi:catechol 2,3-dioxygenase-like lactoylglutathione lyase family enzyme